MRICDSLVVGHAHGHLVVRLEGFGGFTRYVSQPISRLDSVSIACALWCDRERGILLISCEGRSAVRRHRIALRSTAVTRRLVATMSKVVLWDAIWNMSVLDANFFSRPA